MPYFSFTLKKPIDNKYISELKFFKIYPRINIKYYSKNTKLWKLFNKLKNLDQFINLKKEKRTKSKSIQNNVMFFLPPNIGLGDAVEYSLSIKSIIKEFNINNYSIAFVGRYALIFEKYFDLKNIYEEIIDQDSLNKYKIHFHFSLNISSLFNHKNDRVNLEKSINDFFDVPFYRLHNNLDVKNKKIKKISIFPLSTSPIRSMPIEIFNFIVLYLSKNFNIEIILDDQSVFSKIYIKNISITNKITIKTPEDLKSLTKIIEKIQYGIFIDSGPLHVAKILNKKGILLISSVKPETLLLNFNTIKPITGSYKSFFCNGPCGLINAFNYNGDCGCYDSLQIHKNKILELTDKRQLQRGLLKNLYIDMFNHGVNCFKGIDKKKIINIIKKDIY